AYAIATLLNNLFGKSKEPFWQQAYTDLIKFVILLRRLVDGYTTLAEIYRYVLHNALIDQDIQRLQALLQTPPEVLTVPTPEYRRVRRNLPWIHWFPEGPEQMAHPYDADLEGYLASHTVPYRVGPAAGEGWTGRRQQLDAIERWYYQGWSLLD